MKKLVAVLLLTGLSFNICAGSDIIVGQSTGTSKIKKVFTSTPAKVIYALLGIGVGIGIGWIIYHQCKRKISYQLRNDEEVCCEEESGDMPVMEESYEGSRDALVQDTLKSVNWDGYELNQLFKKSGEDIQNYFFPDKNIIYTTGEGFQYKHSFSLKNYWEDNTQLMRLVNALEDCNGYRLSLSLRKIDFNKIPTYEKRITSVSFNPPVDHVV